MTRFAATSHSPSAAANDAIITRGKLTKCRAYDRVLTDDEIFELYDLERSNLDPATGSTLTQGLVGHWSFDGSPAEGFKDKSGQRTRRQARSRPGPARNRR